MSKGRLEAFCDGVFAIAITLLILDLHVPEIAGGQSLRAGLLHEWPSLVAYVVSFVLIGIGWVNHHVLMRHFAHVDRAFLFINLIFLMVVAFIPFPTGVVAAALKAPRTDANLTTAAVFYGISVFALGVMFNIVWQYGRHHLMSDTIDEAEAAGISRSYAIGPLLYIPITLIAFVNPLVSLALFALVALGYALSSSLFSGGRSMT